MHLVVTNQRADGLIHDQYLGGHCACLATDSLNKRLSDDPLEHERELRANLWLLVAWEDVDDAVDRFGGGVGVQRREREVTGFCDRERGLDRLEVAHFTDENDVRIFT